jgi:hypothetical protein
VWIDIFAVRQFPGDATERRNLMRIQDKEDRLDFRSAIRGCHAVIVSVSAFKNLSSVSLGKYLESNSGTNPRKRVPYKRLWCVVEISSAVDAGIDVVVKCGNSQLTQSNETYEYRLSNMEDMWELQYTVDVEQCECSDPEDKIQQLQIVREQQGGVQNFGYWTG